MNKLNNLNKFYIDNKLYDYKLKYSGRKTLEVKIGNDGQIYVSAPFYMSLKDIELFLKQKSEWISNKLHIIKEETKYKNYDISEKKIILLWGKEISFEVKEDNIKRVKLNFIDNKLVLQIPEGFEKYDRDLLIKESLKKLYRKYTLDYLEYRLSFYENITEVRASSFKVKDQKTRWGSCSSKANLNFNFRLSMAPEFVFDYIIVHELCHLKEMNHSQNFWKLVERYYPDYKRAKSWLRDNSRRLMMI